MRQQHQALARDPLVPKRADQYRQKRLQGEGLVWRSHFVRVPVQQRSLFSYVCDAFPLSMQPVSWATLGLVLTVGAGALLYFNIKREEKKVQGECASYRRAGS